MEYNIPAFSTEQVEAAKAKFGSKCLKVLEVFVDGGLQEDHYLSKPKAKDVEKKDGEAEQPAEEPVLFLIKKPSPALVYLLSSKEMENQIEKSSSAMISNCVLAGDADLLNNDASVFTELVERISGLTKSAKSSLKKV